MNKLRVAILFGGKSGEHEVSIASALSVYSALDQSKYDVTLIGIDKEGRWLLPDKTALLAQSKNPYLIQLNKHTQELVGILPYKAAQNLVTVGVGGMNGVGRPRLGFDVIFPVLHGTYGEDGTIQGLLELANVAYVGSGVLGSAVGMDKDIAKKLLDADDIPVVPFFCARREEYTRNRESIETLALQRFGLPYFLKPANMGSSVGVHKVKSREGARAAFEDAFQYDTKVLVERAIKGRELEVSVLGNDNPRASVVGEIVPSHEFYSYEAKYVDEHGAQLLIPAPDLAAGVVKEIQNYAVRAFRALECSGLARVDFFYDNEKGQVYLNEINTLPGFTKISMYPKLWEASGLAYAHLLDELIRLAQERHELKNSLKTTYKPQS